MAQAAGHPQPQLRVEIVGAAVPFAPGAAAEFSAIRLTLSPDGATALWFSRERPGGAGGYDIWMSRRTDAGWSAPMPVPFNSPARDFDPAFAPDGRHVYFCSDRPGGLGGDDLYRVAVIDGGFGAPEALGAAVNSAGNEWAPMLGSDGTLLFASNGRGGAGRFDLFSARLDAAGRLGQAAALPGAINSAADEFDATLLADGSTVVFARAADLKADTVRLFYATRQDDRYDAGTLLPESVNAGTQDAYAPMLDWSSPDHLTFSSRRAPSGAGSVGVYRIRYRMSDKR